MNYKCETCFLKKYHQVSCETIDTICPNCQTVCCSICINIMNREQHQVERERKYKYCFTLGIRSLKVGNGRVRNSIYVSNNLFGFMIIALARIIVRPFRLSVRLRYRTPIESMKGKYQRDIPKHHAKYVAMYFDKIVMREPSRLRG